MKKQPEIDPTDPNSSLIRSWFASSGIPLLVLALTVAAGVVAYRSYTRLSFEPTQPLARESRQHATTVSYFEAPEAVEREGWLIPTTRSHPAGDVRRALLEGISSNAFQVTDYRSRQVIREWCDRTDRGESIILFKRGDTDGRKTYALSFDGASIEGEVDLEKSNGRWRTVAVRPRD